jgi:hypothetical protein
MNYNYYDDNLSDNSNNKNIYYANYNKNVKAIRGSGVITPSNPPNKSKTTGTIKNTWDKNIKPIPPTYNAVYYSDKNLTNGYLNKNNYVEEDEYISNSYYPSQRFNKINYFPDNSKKSKKENNEEKELDKENPIQFPPPLITTKYSKQIKKNLKKNNLTPRDLELIEEIKKNGLYDGKYVYMFETEPIVKNNNIYKTIHIPYPQVCKNFKNDIKDNNKNIEEPFEQTDNSYIESTESNSNIVLLIIFSILLILYFSFYRKK